MVYEEDRFGNIETGDDSTVITASPSAGPGRLSGAAATVSGGVATFTGLSADTAGTGTLQFKGGGLTSAATNSITVSPAAASQLVTHTQPSATATAGQAATQPVIDEEDPYGNLETGDDSTVITAAPGTGSAQLAGTTVTVKGGVATFASLADDTAGTIASSSRAAAWPSGLRATSP